MAISHVAATTSAAAYTSVGTQTTSHAGGTCRAAAVMIVQNASTADQVTGVTYAGAAMTRIGTLSEATEAGRVYMYWLDNVATGTQNVAMTTNGTASKRLVVATMNSGAGTTIDLAGSGTGTSTSTANPTWNITGLTNGDQVMAYLCIHSGLQSMTTTPAANWTLINRFDLGSQGNGFARRTNVTTVSGTTLSAGWTAATADDYVGIAAAFKEVIPPPASVESWGFLSIS